MKDLSPDLTIDALGLLCPLPVLRLRKRMEGLSTGSIVQIDTDDPAAILDIPHFAQEQGHTYHGNAPTAQGHRHWLIKA